MLTSDKTSLRTKLFFDWYFSKYKLEWETKDECISRVIRLSQPEDKKEWSDCLSLIMSDKEETIRWGKRLNIVLERLREDYWPNK